MKACLILGPASVFGYNDVYPLLLDKTLKVGIWTAGWETEKGHIVCNWFTTLPTPNKKKLVLTKRFKHDEYPHYDNYRAIEVGRIRDIPYDYDCVMGVPITIFGYDLDNVVIMGMAAGARDIAGMPFTGDVPGPFVNGKAIYARVFIRLKRGWEK